MVLVSESNDYKDRVTKHVRENEKLVMMKHVEDDEAWLDLLPDDCLESVLLLTQGWKKRACLPTPTSRHVVVHCLVASHGPCKQDFHATRFPSVRGQYKRMTGLEL